MTNTNAKTVKKYRVQISYTVKSTTGYEVLAMSLDDAAAIGKHRFLDELRNPENYHDVRATATEDK